MMEHTGKLTWHRLYGMSWALIKNGLFNIRFKHGTKFYLKPRELMLEDERVITSFQKTGSDAIFKKAGFEFCYLSLAGSLNVLSNQNFPANLPISFNYLAKW